MRISDEIEVSTIAIDKTTILRLDDHIAIPIKFDKVTRSMTAKKSAKKCAKCSKFCLLITFAFCIFSFPSLSLSWLLNLAKQFSI